MRIVGVLRGGSKYGGIHVCLAMFIIFCGFFHHVSHLIVEAVGGRFPVRNDETIRAMALVELIAANIGSLIAYALIGFAVIIFLQVRGRPEWTWWLAAVTFCVPWLLYLKAWRADYDQHLGIEVETRSDV